VAELAVMTLPLHIGDAALYQGDCLAVLASLPDNSVDAIVTDPPYGLAFMGKRWDYDVPDGAIWAECLRVLKPGGHLLAFAGTRTQHRMAIRIEDAGFEIRDMIAWVYGSGFPKSLDVAKGIDKMDAAEEQEARRLRFTAWVRSTGVTSAQIDAATSTNMGGHYTTAASQPAIMTREHLEACRHLLGDVPPWVEREADIRSVESKNFAEREVVGQRVVPVGHSFAGPTYGGDSSNQEVDITAPATPAARQWQGWGTALKPALEPITLARKPLMSSSVNVINLIEHQLRERGVSGEILWKPEHANAAEKSNRPSNSSSIPAHPMVGTSAKNVAESVTQNDGPQPLKNSEQIMPHGANQIASMCANTTSKSETNCETKCLMPMEESAPAAESVSETFSQSTTSTAEGHSIGCPSTGKCTTNSSEKDSQPDTEFFVGIATGLTGSTTHVHIKRDSNGFYIWPKGLPKFVAGTALTVAANVLAHGTGALNVDGCRVGTESTVRTTNQQMTSKGKPGGAFGSGGYPPGEHRECGSSSGRFPANLIHDGSAEVVGLFPKTNPSPSTPVKQGGHHRHDVGLSGVTREGYGVGYGDTGSAARFFYCAKASKDDRDDGCEGMEERDVGDAGRFTMSGPMPVNYTAKDGIGRTLPRRNHHPTVKPTTLMRYLCRLITPPGGVVLDPFMGSGSTGLGAWREGFRFIGIEREAEYFTLAIHRLRAAQRQPDLFHEAGKAEARELEETE
jgi:DNA modification methylase